MREGKKDEGKRHSDAAAVILNRGKDWMASLWTE